MPAARLSLEEARRIALAAQGFDRPRPARPRAADVSRAIARMGIVQLDFVNVLVPSHFLTLFSRLGPYDRRLLHEVVYRRRAFIEQWAHEASIVPVDLWPFLEHRRQTHRVRPYGFEKFLESNPKYLARLLEEVRARGPITADQASGPEGRDRRLPPEYWVGTIPRAVLEAHFARGLVAIAERKPNFARSYDLAERVVPQEHYRKRADPEDSVRELVRRASKAHGVAAASDLADYFRMPAAAARRAISELVAAEELTPVAVEGWREPAYLARGARAPKKIETAALLSPFDPVVWFRPRTARLFGFDYRLEIFVPQGKRRWGYYVLPFLLGDRLVARVDVKAARAARRLLVLAAYRERHADADAVAPMLARELVLLARWLSLDEGVAVERRGDLARALAAAVRVQSYVRSPKS